MLSKQLGPGLNRPVVDAARVDAFEQLDSVRKAYHRDMAGEGAVLSVESLQRKDGIGGL